MSTKSAFFVDERHKIIFWDVRLALWMSLGFPKEDFKPVEYVSQLESRSVNTEKFAFAEDAIAYPIISTLEDDLKCSSKIRTIDPARCLRDSLSAIFDIKKDLDELNKIWESATAESPALDDESLAEYYKDYIASVNWDPEPVRYALLHYWSYEYGAEVRVYENKEMAKAALKAAYEEELRVQTKEIGHAIDDDLECEISPGYEYASITIYVDTEEQVDTWQIAPITE